MNSSRRSFRAMMEGTLGFRVYGIGFSVLGCRVSIAALWNSSRPVFLEEGFRVLGGSGFRV